MKLVRCNGCNDFPNCLHRVVHDQWTICNDQYTKRCNCRPLRARRMWQVYDPTGRPVGPPQQTRRQAVYPTTWPMFYRRGWRCRPVTVIEEG